MTVFKPRSLSIKGCSHCATKAFDGMCSNWLKILKIIILVRKFEWYKVVPLFQLWIFLFYKTYILRPSKAIESRLIAPVVGFPLKAPAEFKKLPYRPVDFKLELGPFHTTAPNSFPPPPSHTPTTCCQRLSPAPFISTPRLPPSLPPTRFSPSGSSRNDPLLSAGPL